MKRHILAILFLLVAVPVCAQQAVVTKAVDASTGATTDVGNATDHAIRVTQASGGTVWTFNWTQLLGAAPSATNPMPSRLTDGTTYIDPRSIRALTSADVVTVVQGTGSNLHVVVDTAPTTAVTGTFWQATQPVSGTFFQATQPVSIASMPSTPVTGTFWQATQPVSGTVTTTPPANASTNIAQIGGAAFALGQQVAAASLPMVLTAAQLSTLTPPAAITGFALEAGNLATLAGAVSSSVVQENVKQVNGVTVLTGTGATGTGAQRVTVAVDSATVAGSASLPAGTNVIGHVVADTGSTTAVTGNVAVTSAGLTNLDVALSTRTKPADQQHAILDSGTTAVTQATGTNLHAVLDTTSTTAVTQATGTNLHAVLDSGTITTVSAVTAITNALPAGTALLGKVGIDQTTPGTTNAVQANAGTNLNTSALALDATLTGRLPAAAAAADGLANPTVTQIGADGLLFNGTTWDRQHGNWRTTTGDTGTKTTTFAGATQTNFDASGAWITVQLGTVSGTTPTLSCQMQYSFDAGTTWVNFGAALTNLTASNNTGLIIVYPSNVSQAAGVTPANLTSGATATMAINAPLPRTWRINYTIGGTTPSFAVTAVHVSYQR